MCFSLTPSENRRVVLTATDVRDTAEVTVNGKAAGTFLFRPYELDITPLVGEGENEIALSVTPGPANRWGSPTPCEVRGLTVRIYDISGS